MAAAISTLLAALAVILSLSAATRSESAESGVMTFFNRIIELFNGNGKLFTASEAATGILLALVVYLTVFSVSYFVMRFLAIFLAAFGFPDETSIRRNRELRRGKGTELSLLRRQARMNAVYTVRAQQAAVVAQRRRQARTTGGGASPLADPSLSDFNIKK